MERACGSYYRCGFDCLMMNDVTLKHIAAVKAIVSKGATSGYRTTSGDPPRIGFQIRKMRGSTDGVCIKLLNPYKRTAHENEAVHYWSKCSRKNEISLCHMTTCNQRDIR
jgi:hypothetical protein